MHLVQCVSAVKAVEVQVFLCNHSYLNDTSLARIQVASQFRVYRKMLKGETQEGCSECTAVHAEQGRLTQIYYYSH